MVNSTEQMVDMKSVEYYPENGIFFIKLNKKIFLNNSFKSIKFL